MPKTELTAERTEQQAQLLGVVNNMLCAMEFDWDYLKDCQRGMVEQQSNFDTLAAIHGKWNPAKSDLLKEKANALGLIIKYVESLKKCDELKAKQKAYDEMTNMFNF